jgi:hypothetical protein
VDFGGSHGADPDTRRSANTPTAAAGYDEDGVTGSKTFTGERLSMFVETDRLLGEQHELRDFRWMFQN